MKEVCVEPPHDSADAPRICGKCSQSRATRRIGRRGSTTSFAGEVKLFPVVCDFFTRAARGNLIIHRPVAQFRDLV